MLKSETNSREIELEIRATFEQTDEVNIHHPVQLDFEQGQWFVTCIKCGKQWSVNDTEDDFCFEEVSCGDEFCNDIER